MTRKMAVTATFLTALLGLRVWAQDGSALADENAELRDRVENLERQVQELAGVEGGPGSTRTPLWSNLDVQFYGYIKGDAAYDNSRTTSGNYVVWVDNEEDHSNDDEFNMTANETRLGVMIRGPKGEGMETSGQVEFDFFGSGAAENKAKIQMRHAYLQVEWPDDGLALLAGQTWDVISPLNPSTLNYTVLWDAGNIGYRRPQIRLTKSVLLSGDTSVKLEGAISRTIGRNVAITGVTSESGEDAGFPTVQGRVSATFPWLPAGATTIGVSGHRGQEEYDIDPTGTNRDFDSWSLNLDFLQPITDWITFKAELFRGENLDSYFGGIGQGVRTAGADGHDREISSKGGWCALALTPWDRWTFNAGIGIDDVDADDVNVGDRTLNRSVFGNAIYALNQNVDVGVELSHWRTDYRGPGDADNVRIQTSLKYKF